GTTALHIAALFNNIEISRLLIALNANPFIRTDCGKKPLDLSASPTMTLLLANYESYFIQQHTKVTGIANAIVLDYAQIESGKQNLR
ncbi:MAG: ankyrin repeat domain-containing protein, partial [Alphaproteobacteria bacterium]